MNDHTTPTRRPGLRDEIAEALIAWTYRGKDPEHNGILETVRANAYSRADAVLAVLYREWPWLRAEAEETAPADQTALRDRTAAALYEHSHPGWAISFPDLDQDQRDTYLARAAAVLAVLPAPVDRRAVLREAANHLDNSERLRDLTDNHMLDINAAANELRRVADETAATETPDEAWQREWDRRPDGADVSDLFEITAVVPCSGTLFSAHPPHTWEPQPGVPAVHCPGERQPAAGARQDGVQTS